MHDHLRSHLNVPKTCAACAVRGATVCAPLTEAELGVVEGFKSGNRTLPAGSDLYDQGEPCSALYTLLDGWVLLYQMLEDGGRQILDFALPGAFLGFQPDLDAPMPHAAQALTDVAVCIFPRRKVLDLFAAHPQLALRMTGIVARDCQISHDHLTNVGQRQARERVAHLLLELFYRIRLVDPSPHGDTVILPLTQEHIADALGLTGVHVNRTLRRLREEGLLAMRGGRLRVLDADALAEVAGFDDQLLLHCPIADTPSGTRVRIARTA